MDITCKRCGAFISADDVNMQALAAKCRSCSAVFSIADQVAPATGFAPQARLDVPLPQRFTVERPGGALEISWRWYTPAAIFLTAFAVFWNGFICMWVAAALSGGAGFFALFATFHALVGVAMAYGALTMFLNTTRVAASYNMLSVRHGPLPSFGNLDLPRDGLRQLYCVERLSSSRRSRSLSYDLQAVKADGSAVTVLRGLESAEQALYLEQELERFMSIKDEPVRGEIHK